MQQQYMYCKYIIIPVQSQYSVDNFLQRIITLFLNIFSFTSLVFLNRTMSS